MDLTDSYLRVLPDSVRQRYQCYETRNAAAIAAATNHGRFADLLAVLDGFSLCTKDLIEPGGSESKLAARLNAAFRDRGWREARVDTRIALRLKKTPYLGEVPLPTVETEVVNEGYLVDNFADRVALDVEWNAKDGNLDRDLSAYRYLYESGLIDVAVLITRTQDGLRQLAYRLGVDAGKSPEEAKRFLGTTTTTNTDKLLPRMTRGDGGGCPLLAVAICERTWSGGDTPEDDRRGSDVQRSTLFD